MEQDPKNTWEHFNKKVEKSEKEAIDPIEDIKSILNQQNFHQQLTKRDIYFRNQSKLMTNSIIPEAERKKINDKM